MLDATAVVLLRCAETGRSYWAWTDEEWAGSLGRDQDGFRKAAPAWADDAGPSLPGRARLPSRRLHRFLPARQLQPPHPGLAGLRPRPRWTVRSAGSASVLAGWGYRLGREDDTLLPMVACQVFLLNRSPHLEDLSTAAVRPDPQRAAPSRPAAEHAARDAASRGSPGLLRPAGRPAAAAARTGRAAARAEWARWADRWYATSTLTPGSAAASAPRCSRPGAGWQAEHPEAADPAAWTRQTCAAWIAALDRMNVGDYVQRTAGLARPHRQAAASRAPRQPSSSAVRTFFRDCQEWEWLPRRFDPQRALATPRSVSGPARPGPAGDRRRGLGQAAMGRAEPAGRRPARDPGRALLPDGAGPRDHADLAVLRAAQRRDRPAARGLHPLAARRAPRSPATHRRVLARDAVCLLDVPAHKTGTAFTKPVDPILGQAIDAWQAVRPGQPQLTDRKHRRARATCCSPFRAQPVSTPYINNTVIPMLCRKAGVPAADVRGNITSHRARSTIASQLYNAKEPMTLFELQAWLGHRSPQSTQFYAKISPEHAHPGLHRRRVLLPQRPHHRGPHRP